MGNSKCLRQKQGRVKGQRLRWGSSVLVVEWSGKISSQRTFTALCRAERKTARQGNDADSLAFVETLLGHPCVS